MAFQQEACDPKLRGLFEEMYVIHYEKLRQTTFMFRSYNYDITRPDGVKRLINDIYLIYGRDISGQGKFDDSDKEWINRGKWDGRYWSNEEFVLKPSVSWSKEHGLIAYVHMDKNIS